MSKIVELVGAPGVGKTTLFKEIESRWNKNCSWMPGHQLYPRKKITAENSGSFILDIFRRIRDRHGKVDTKAMEEAGVRFVETFPGYVDACWKNINCIQKKNINGLDLRFQKVCYLYKLIQKIQTLREHTSNKTAIVDEGLIHILTTVLGEREGVREEIDRFLEMMPLPEAVIFIETEVKENIKRLAQRKKVIPMHKYLQNGQLESVIRLDGDKRTVINTIIKSKSIPFLHIDSADSIDTNASKIIFFADNL